MAKQNKTMCIDRELIDYFEGENMSQLVNNLLRMEMDSRTPRSLEEIQARIKKLEIIKEHEDQIRRLKNG